MNKQSLQLKMAIPSTLFLVSIIIAQQPKLPAGYPPGQYDESKVPEYILPNPLILLNGEKVTDTLTWQEKRRPEILKLFETHVYGRTLINRPDNMHWEVTSESDDTTDSTPITKNVTIYFSKKNNGPKMELKLTLPEKRENPVPIFLIPGWIHNHEILFERGYGLAVFNPWQIEPDQKEGSYEKSIRKFFAQPGQTEPLPDEWGAIGAWAWATSRAMDYLETDPDVDSDKVCILGFSRFGKVAMWAGAQDQRFAIVFSGGSGCGGAVIVRRGFGETVRSINGYALHWFCGNFKTYNDQVNDLPIDWHMLVALMAPRPIYIAVAEEDYWGDPRGSFLSGKHAEPVYRLFGKVGLGLTEMPPVEVTVGKTIGFHNRRGGHDLNHYDWEQFVNFADRHFGLTKSEK